MRGVILDIQKFCLHDGPGIRTTVFLKGCMMRCQWCHNPESFKMNPQLGYRDDKCVGCQRCGQVCREGVHSFDNNKRYVDFEKCTACGKCVSSCVADALQIYGKYIDSQEVIKEVLKDKKYYNTSGGGVTFSGGEPTVQMDFLIDLVNLSKENGLHVCLETNGYIKHEKLIKLIPLIDLWLYDYKATGKEKHMRLTGVENDLPLSNLKTLYENSCPVILRCPMVSGINDENSHFSSIAELKQKYSNIISAQIMPYHNFGISKWEQIGLESSINLPNTPDNIKKSWEGKLKQ